MILIGAFQLRIFYDSRGSVLFSSKVLTVDYAIFMVRLVFWGVVVIVINIINVTVSIKNQF